MDNGVLVEVKNLKKYFSVETGFVEKLLTKERSFVKAVDDVSLSIKKGEVMGLCGESGCGKTTMGRLIMRLEDATDGNIYFNGQDITNLSGSELTRFRPNMQMVFQDPHASLNPRMSVGEAIGHSLAVQRLGNKREREERVREVMERVALAPVDDIIVRHPHLLSGGQKQRVVLARALVVNPKLVVADEPIAMADVSVRALILELMLELKKDFDLTYLFITHDLATAKYICDRIAVMYLGIIVELGDIDDVFMNPAHPYTEALLSAVPVPDPTARRQHKIPRGEIPSAVSPPPGCRFHTRCPIAIEICQKVKPDMIDMKKGHYAACHLARRREKQYGKKKR